MDSVVGLDAKVTGRRREEYFKTKLKLALAATGIEVSLAAEVGGCFAGFLLARVYYGEFGQAEATAVLDTFDVHPDFRGVGVGRALFRQLAMNLRALDITRLETQVAWSAQELLSFFQHQGFVLSQRVCLELDLTRERARSGDEDWAADESDPTLGGPTA
jgi:GNAT superfamily N-acetyltransferase